MTKAETAYRLHYEDGLSWREVGERMGISRRAAMNHGAYWRKREAISAKSRERYATDPEFRAKRLAACKARDPAKVREYRSRPAVRKREKARRTTPEHRETANARRRERYASDPAYREKMKARSNRYREENIDKVRAKARERSTRPEVKAARAEWYEANREELAARQRCRIASDPEYRARRNAARREWAERNAERQREYRREHRAANRPRLLMNLSVWRYGPELGPVHRALCDLKAALRAKERENETANPERASDARGPDEEPSGPR